MLCGGGVVGLSIAYQCASSGWKVLVVDSGEIGQAAGAGGVEQVIEIPLDDAAKAGLQVSIDAVKELLVACKGIEPSLS